MHEFILKIFGFTKSLLYFLRLVCVFCILMLLLYWINNLASFNWSWLGFIKPFLDSLLAIANSIYSVSFNLFGAVFEFKYLSALIILILASLCFKLLDFSVNLLEGLYLSTRFLCKKTEEKFLNKKLQNDMEKEEKSLNKYTVVITTQIKKKFAHQELHINIDEQNKLMNDFIFSKTNIKPMIFSDSFIYKFKDFNDIDTILDTLFKILKSNAPLDYAICIQIEGNDNQINKLVELKHFGKITMAADTAYRYRFNASHRYQTSQAGLFQYDGGTLEVHEFKEIL